MESSSEVIKKIEAQDLISRFRSKEDLYKYLIRQSKTQASSLFAGIVNLFLPSLDGTKIGFLRAILKEEKKAFKINQINFMGVPNYPEISVKNLYDDAMQDEDIEIYLPTREQLSNKLPERKFFFEILGTVKPDYLSEIIQETHKKRFSISPEDPNQQGILISDSWLEELKKHPYLSKKPETGIFLVKEHAKVYRSRKSQQSHNVSKRLSEKRPNPDKMNIDSESGSMRRKVIQQEQIEEVKVPMRNPIFKINYIELIHQLKDKNFFSTFILPCLALVIVFSLFTLIIALTIKSTVSIGKSCIK